MQGHLGIIDPIRLADIASMLRQQVTPDNSERLGGMIEYLEDLAGTALGVATRSVRETAILEIRHIFVESYLKSTNKCC